SRLAASAPFAKAVLEDGRTAETAAERDRRNPLDDDPPKALAGAAGLLPAWLPQSAGESPAPTFAPVRHRAAPFRARAPPLA
ncbi:MAG: hypothetical protein ACK40O_12890, partial [Allosphingosinicella sp.]